MFIHFAGCVSVAVWYTKGSFSSFFILGFVVWGPGPL